jgi:hypothetical protein
MTNNSFVSVALTGSDGWESNKAAETMINKLSQCEKYLKIIVNNTKRINSLNQRKSMLSATYEPAGADGANDEIPYDEGEQSSSMTQNSKMSFNDLKEINRLFPLKTANEIFEMNEKIMNDVTFRKKIVSKIYFFFNHIKFFMFAFHSDIVLQV